MSLPSGYKRLEYIQSSGTQYIDTGVKPNQDTRVKMVIVHTSITGAWQGIMSARDGAGERYGNNFSLWVTAGAAYRSDYGPDNGASGGTAIASTKTSIDKNKNIATIGSTELTDNIATFQCNYTLHLLTGWSGGAYEYPAYARIYSCQIYDNGTLIRYFVPCKNASGVVGLWDDVNGKFYANAGTGAFSAGPEVTGTHKARIDATDYEIKGGSCTIDATAYKIKKGRTRIDGTGYDIAVQSDANSLTWHLDEVVDVSYDIDEAIGFYSNGERYIGIRIGNLMGRCLMYRKASDHVWSTRYLSGKWGAEGYRTLVFDELPTGALLEWLQANGTAI